jgi:hypothetical protein
LPPQKLPNEPQKPQKPWFLTASLLFSLSVTSCGQKTEINKRGSIKDALKVGRQVVRTDVHSEQSSGQLRLTTSALSSYKQDEWGGHYTHATFDTRLLPDVNIGDLQEYALDFLETNEAFLVDTNHIKLSGHVLTTIRQGLILLRFTGQVDGYPIRDGFVKFFFAEQSPNSFRLASIVNNMYGPITVSNLHEGAASLSSLGSAAAKYALTASRQIILPKREGQEIRFYRATELQLTGSENSVGPVTYVLLKNGSGEILEAYEHAFAARHKVSGLVYDRSYYNEQPQAYPLPFTDVTIGQEKLTTDGDGYVDVVTAEATAIVNFDSARSQLTNLNAGNAPVNLTATLANGEYVVNVQNDELVALNAFVSVQRINRFTRRHLTPQEARLLDENILTFVNDPQILCNAYFQMEGPNLNIPAIHFAPEGAAQGCANTGLTNDIVYHEWGHALDEYTSLGIRDFPRSEGIGDILAAYYTGSPEVGRGFELVNGQGVRNLAQDYIYPQDRDPNSEHNEGRIIGSTFWDLREALIARYGAVRGAFKAESLFFQHLLISDVYTFAYDALLTLDDDDNNPETPSPNLCLINTVFSAHGLATLLANCVDQPTNILPIDDELFLSIKGDDQKQTTLMASGANVSFLSLCEGNLVKCLIDDTPQNEMILEGQILDRSFYTLSLPKFQVAQELTLISRDAYYKPQGVLPLKVVFK